MSGDLLRGRQTCTVEEAARICGIGRHTAYEAARRYLATGGREGLPVLKFGRRLVVSVPALLRLIDEARP